MTSKISFSNLVRAELKQKTWLAALQLLVFGIMIPFRVLLTLTTFENSDTSNYYIGSGNMPSTVTDVFCEIVGVGHSENTVFILIMGGVCALCAFSWVHASDRLDFYHSLALKRPQLFAAKYLGSTLSFALPYLACQLLAVLIGLCYGAVPARAAAEVLIASVQGILFFLCSFASVLTAVMLTGAMITTLLAVCFFGLYLPMLWYLTVLLEDVFQNTRIYTASKNLLAYSSPWAFCLTQTGEKEGLTGLVPGVDDLCQLVAIAAILTLISLALYRSRRTEAAGRSLSFAPVESILKLLISIPAGIGTALIAHELYDSVLWDVVFALLFGTLACVIMELIYRRDFRQALAHKLCIPLTAAVSLAVFLAFRYDIFGYNTYLPDRGDVTGMAVTLENYYLDLYYPVDSDSEKYGYLTTAGLLDYMETSDSELIDLIYALAEDGVARAGDTSGSYDSDYEQYVCVKYHTSDGRETYRTYQVDGSLYDKTSHLLLENDSFRRAWYPIYSWSEEYIKNFIYVSCEFFDDDLSLLIQNGDSGSESGETEAEAETETETEMESGAGAENDAETQNGFEMQSSTETQTDAETQSSSETQSGSIVENGTETVNEAIADSETAMTSEAITDSGSEAENETDLTEEANENADGWGSGNIVAYDADGAYVEESFTSLYIPASRAADLVAAYRLDLDTLSGEQQTSCYSGEYAAGLYFSGEDFTCQYPFNENFTNTIRVLQEISETIGQGN